MLDDVTIEARGGRLVVTSLERLIASALQYGV
jgi:hypothetical protein